MNSNYENGSSMSMEDLVNMNAEATVPLNEVPYQPIVYAGPQEWLASWKNLRETAVRFQPTLYRQITPLATREEQENLRVKMRADVEVAKREVEKSLKELKEQDGKKKETFYSDLSKIFAAEVKTLQDEYDKQQKKNLQYMGITVGASAVLSALVSGLLLLLGG